MRVVGTTPEVAEVLSVAIGDLASAVDLVLVAYGEDFDIHEIFNCVAAARAINDRQRITCVPVGWADPPPTRYLRGLGLHAVDFGPERLGDLIEALGLGPRAL